MNLGELKNKIDEFYNRYGSDMNVMIDLNFDPKVDNTIAVIRGKISSQNVVNITETMNKNNKIDGICISNYKMEE